MDSAKGILHSIVEATEQIQNATNWYSKSKGIRQVQQHSLVRFDFELQTIAKASCGILKVLDDPLLCRRYVLEVSFMSWLSSSDPEICLHTLEEMEKLLSIEREDWLAPAEPACEEEEVHATIVLFQAHKAHFHFLLTTDIWNTEGISSEAEGAGGVHGHEQSRSLPVKTVAENQHKEIVVQKLKKFLEFLDAVDCSEKHRQTCSMRQPGTCVWLLNTGAYRSWKEGKSVLWLRGKAGAGKTVLTSSVIDDLRNNKRDGEFLAYFYCDFRTRRSTNAVEVMRSILSQLLGHLCATTADPEDLLDNLQKESKDGFYNVKELSLYISKIAALFPRNGLVIVDALDECGETESLLDGLSVLRDRDIRVFVTSRPLQNITGILSPFQCISMDQMASGLSVDTDLHVKRELDSRQQLRSLDRKLKEEIQLKLCSKADGMFRWVQCQIDALEICSSASDIRIMLNALPKGLEETYRRILLAINRQPSNVRIVQRALVWLVAALRPMRMRELLEGLMIDRKRRTLDPRFDSITGVYLLEVCRSLLVHHEETDIITLSHMSVKEYLVGELIQAKLPRYHIALEDAHEQLARLCMAYIAFCLDYMKESRDWSSTLVKERDLGHPTFDMSRPLLAYILSHGFSHLAHLGSGNARIFEDIHALQEVTRQFPREWGQMCKLAPSDHPGIAWPSLKHDFVMYTLISFSSDALFKTIINHNTFASMPEANPLVYAARFGRVAHAKILISWGAHINDPGLVVDHMDADNTADHMDEGDEGESGAGAEPSNAGNTDNCQVIPIETAVEHWHREMTELLLAGGSTVPDQLLTRVLTKHPDRFPLYIIKLLLRTTKLAEWAAASWNSQPLLEALVERDGENPEESGVAALLDCVQRLVDIGCARSPSGKTILHIAAERGYIQVIKRLLPICATLPADIVFSALRSPYPQRAETTRLLIKHGADVNPFTINGDTPLHVCIRSFDEFECLRITQVLVEDGNLVHAHDAADRPPIHLAVTRGFVSAVEYLLLKGVCLPDRILFTVMQGTYPRRNEMVQLLVRKQANLHILDDHTLLQVATTCLDESDTSEITKIIINASHDPSTSSTHDDVFQTHLTVINNHLLSLPAEDILSALSHNGVPTRKSILAFLLRKVEWTPTTGDRGLTLQDITQRFSTDVDRCLRVAQMLVSIQHNFSSWDYGPALAALFSSAVAHGAISTAEYLLSQGIPPPRRIIFDAVLSITGQRLEDDNLGRKRRKTLLGVSAVDRSPDADDVLKMVRLCLSAGAEAQLLDDYNNTVIHLAVSEIRDEDLCLEVMKILIKAGGNPSVANAEGDAPMQIAVTRGFAHVVKYLLSLGLSPPPRILFSVLKNWSTTYIDERIIHSLVRKHTDVRATAPDGECLLHAVMRLDEETDCSALTELFLNAGCISTLNAQGVSPTQIALDRGFSRIVKRLISWGAPFPRDVLFVMFQRELWHKLPDLDVAVISFITTVLRRGADVNGFLPNGDTLLHAAVRSFKQDVCFEVIRRIVQAGCRQISTVNKGGKTATELAAARGFDSAVAASSVHHGLY